jgi:hypothetical protein
MRDGDAGAVGRFVLWPLLLYTGASLWHFAHNAIYIEAYPNMPPSLSAARVWLGWAALASLGVLGFLLLRSGRRRLGLAIVGVYGLLGFDGLAHYTLASLREHTLTMNLTIWGEAVAAALLLIATLRCMLQMRAEVGPSGPGAPMAED